ncbi:MAG: glycoside hydrolase family 13 protein [Chloroflexi bacterium]|nr:glycoside hydrolase family 13 protein [Chloroflexota bacterium]
MNLMAPNWIQDAVFYQIFPERFDNGDQSNDPTGVRSWGDTPTYENYFGGDLQGILNRLPYLQELGITALYLTPIFKAHTNHKYDTCDYLQVDPSFGDLPLLRKLVTEAHNRGIRVVLDAVFNHCGDGFWAFEDLCRKGNASAYKDWFLPQSLPIRQDPPNYQTCGGAAYLPKLNLANLDLRRYLLDVAVYWMREAGIDGWRLDVPWKVPMDFWGEFRQVVKEANSEAFIVGEVWRDPLPWLSGDTCDGIMNYLLREAILDFCVRDTMDAEDFDHFTTRLRQDYGAAGSSQLNLLGSHDTPRLLTLCQGDVSRVILALTAQFTAPGAPMIYYGDEIGMAGGNDPDCRRCMDWDSTHWDQRIHQTIRNLIQARREHPALRSLGYESLLVFNGVYAFRRFQGQDEVIVVLNPRHAQREIQLPIHSEKRLWRDLFSDVRYRVGTGGLSIPILPEKNALLLFPEE